MKTYREHRFPCELKTTILTPDGRDAAEVINISQSGARVVHHGGLKPGDKVRLNLFPGREPLPAQVRWHRADMLGLRFERILAPADVTRVRASVTGARAKGATQLHVGLRELR